MEASAGISGLGRALVQNNMLLQQDADAILRQSQASHISFVEQLIQSKKMTAQDVAMFASKTFGYPLLDMSAIDLDQLPKGVVDDELIASRRLLPLLKRGNKLYVGTSDPTQTSAYHAITFKTGMTVEVVVVEDDKLGKMLGKYGEDATAAIKALENEDFGDLEFADPDAPADTGAQPDVDDAPVVKFIHKVLLDAINGGASDIHFEPYEKFYRIRYRVDGVLKEISQPPLVLKEKIASRIKVISKLDISEKRVPQDGRMKLVISKARAIDFRVSTLPTLYGEKIVMRILDSSAANLDIEQLGFEPEQKRLLLDAIGRPYGMVLVTGPTGSGKTVSLYTCLNLLNKPDINIATAEDPVEINLPGINQVNVNERAGLTFASALKAFLRQDPDVIMVGEIRDFETADIAIKAAQTGHMVFSTLHTNNAPATLTRMLNMGVAPFNIASSVLLIMAQRLARRLCAHCKKPADIPEEALLRAGFKKEELDGSWKPYAPVGCEECRNTGYRGRTGIYEVMPITDAMTRLIMQNGTAIDIADLARKEGMVDLRHAGLLKVKAGLTSLTEIEAVTNE
ncbi:MULTISPECIES: type IV-A pilus assembly ATPase PilB [unclassified Chromobacterium]|uniref:type IV-A pilus assembly ATPase PilB n=1 Tax=Chromobacterium TaxID=535 RepID=UPI000D325C39|nr:type IV-A pilus assembly ATPase PilB [Chromobacterium sp. S0633]PTU66587.1 type IV-A pilus assembly ATPase PilB [Chromobacterium sp. Panama]UJB33640.1 type IV-A pilus assembly ATPase PilB [Chromobacterium sp. Beijing]